MNQSDILRDVIVGSMEKRNNRYKYEQLETEERKRLKERSKGRVS